MQHVDDALLVAYADGEVTPSERGAVEAHLVSCAECRARVEEERVLAQRASAVLGFGALDAAAVPLFDDVLRRTGRSDATSSAALTALRPPRHTLRPFALAATLIVALGAGWIARTLFLSPGFNAAASRGEATANDAPQPPAVATAPTTTPAEPAARQGFDAQAGAQESVQEEVSTDAEQADVAAVPPDADASVAAARAPVQELRMADSVALEPLPAAAAFARTDSAAAERTDSAALAHARYPAAADSAAARARADGRVVTVAAAPPPPLPPTPEPAQQKSALMESATAVGTVATPGEVAVADAEWQGTSAAVAAARGTLVRGVPDAPVELVWIGRSSAPWRARIVQRIDGATVEIVEWRALGVGTAGSEGTLPDGRSYVFTTSGSALLRLRADLPLARLRAVAAQVTSLE